jgi:ribosomal protein S27AE
MTPSTPRESYRLLVVPLMLVLLLALPALSAPADADIGAGSTVTVTTQIRMLFTEGGGYIDWEISGEVVKDIRRNIDTSMGNGDGNVTTSEGQAYIGRIDQVLEGSYLRYGCARIVQTALLRKDIRTDTEGLLTGVNSSAKIIIHFYFNADLRNDAATVNMADRELPLAVFRALEATENQTYTYVGNLEWKHTEIMIGLASFSSLNLEKGSVTRLRGPGIEVLLYELKTTGNESPSDTARYEPFNMLQCSLELFVLLCICGLATVMLPRYFMKEKKMKKVKWLHSAAWLLVLVVLLLFFFGADGVAIWLASPLFAILSGLFSYKIYVKGWKGIAKPLVTLPDSIAPDKALDKAPGSTSYRDITEGEEAPAEPVKAPTKEPWTPTKPPAFPEPQEKAEGPGAPPEEPRLPAVKPPAPSTTPTTPAAAPAVTVAPAATPVKVLRLKCPKCKETFETNDYGTRPLKLKCGRCGAEGMLRK